MNVDAMTLRIRAEFEEMPGLSLTLPQASRLFGVDHDLCRQIVDRLVGAEYLRWGRAGVVTRGDRS